MGSEHVERWRKVAEIAGRQHGVITTRQLKACGIVKGSIQKAKDSGRLWPLHRGVWAVGHAALSREGRWHAAVLASGGALSHRSAGNVWRCYRWEPARIEVTVATGGTHSRPGILIHSSPLPEAEVIEWKGMLVTTPARTAVDLAHALTDEDRIHEMLREMQYRGLFDREAIERANLRRPSAVLTRVLTDLRPTRSPLEDAFKSKVIRRYGIPEPDHQGGVRGKRVDFRWTAARLTVEVYGNHHVNPSMLQTDAARDNDLGLAGELVLRYMPADIHRRHQRTAAQILEALHGRHEHGPTGGPNS